MKTKNIFMGLFLSLLIGGFNAYAQDEEQPQAIKNNKALVNTKIATPLNKDMLLQDSPTALIEADLYAEYSKKELSNMGSRKSKLLKQMKEGNKKSEMELKELKTEQTTKQTNLDVALLNSSRLRNDIVLRIRPLPPCPPDTECGGISPGFLLLTPEVRSVQGKIYDMKNNEVGHISNEVAMTDEKTGAKAYKINIKDGFSGEVTMKITRIDKNGMKESYAVARTIK